MNNEWIIHFNLIDDGKPKPLTKAEVLDIVRKLELPAGVRQVNVYATLRLPQGAKGE